MHQFQSFNQPSGTPDGHRFSAARQPMGGISNPPKAARYPFLFLFLFHLSIPIHQTPPIIYQSQPSIASSTHIIKYMRVSPLNLPREKAKL
jgi:hypothetical protein